MPFKDCKGWTSGSSEVSGCPLAGWLAGWLACLCHWSASSVTRLAEDPLAVVHAVQYMTRMLPSGNQARGKVRSVRRGIPATRTLYTLSWSSGSISIRTRKKVSLALWKDAKHSQRKMTSTPSLSRRSIIVSQSLPTPYCRYIANRVRKSNNKH